MRFSHLLNFFLQILLVKELHCWVLHSLWSTLCPSLAKDLLLEWHSIHLFLHIAEISHYRISWSHSFWLYYLGFVWCCILSICTLKMSPFSMIHIPLQLKLITFLDISWYLKLLYCLLLGGSISVSTHSFFVALLLRMSLSQEMASSCTWNGIYFFVVWVFSMAYLHYLFCGSVMISASSIIPYF